MTRNRLSVVVLGLAGVALIFFNIYAWSN